MKLNKVWAGALALLALMACDKDIEPSQASLGSVEPKTKTVQVNLTAGQDANAMRVAFGIDDSGKTTGLLMSERNVVLRVMVRRGDAKPVGQDLLFTKTPGRNHATYSGPIQIPTGGSGAYQIAAVLLKEAPNGDSDTEAKIYGEEASERDKAQDPSLDPKCFVKFSSTGILTPSTSSLEANIPYVCEWKELEVKADAVQPTALLLKPMGTLLRIRIKNTTAQAVSIDHVTFVTNAFGNSISLDGNAINSSKLGGYGVNNTERIDLRFKSAVTIESNQFSPWVYTVLYPRDIISSTLPSIGTQALVRNSANRKFSGAFSTKQLLPTGSVPVTLNYLGDHTADFADLIEKDPFGSDDGTQPKMAIEYVATHDLDKSKSAFVTTHSSTNDQVGFFNKEQMQQIAQSLPSALSGYHVPTAAEMKSIFPPRTDLISGFHIDENRLEHRNFIDREIKIGNSTRDYVSDYSKKDKDSPLYALRFKDTKQCTAYRYRSTDIQEMVGGSLTTVGKGLVIECIYIGNNETITIEDIAKETFWTARASEIKSRIFPFYGDAYHPDAPIMNTDKAAHHWTTTAFNESSSWYTSTSNHSHGAYVSLKSQKVFANIRLFSDN